jgi:hypothetical protein
MGARLSDSRLYAHLWGTEELRAVFDEEARLQSWLDILAALAAAQAELGIIPASSAEAIAAVASVDRLDLDLAAEETRRTSHSTLGLIAALQLLLPAEAAGHVYYGATVQDLTDTWTALAMRQVGGVVWRDLGAVEELLLDLAERHRDTLMAGRTHGQPGSPSVSRRPPGRTRCGATASGSPRGRPAGSLASSAARWAPSPSSATGAWSCGRASASDWGCATRWSPGSPPATASPSSGTCSPW